MLKNIKDLSNIIKLDNQIDEQNKVNKSVIFDVLKIVKKESGLNLEEKNILVKKNILKIKSNSNTRFAILLHLRGIDKKIKDLKLGFILEL